MPIGNYQLDYQIPTRSFSEYDVPKTSAASPNIMGAAGALSGLIGIVGDIYTSKENEKARKVVLDSQERIANMQAEDAKRRGHKEMAYYRSQGKKRVGATRAALAASGIQLDIADTTAQQLQQEELDEIEFNALTIINNASREALGYRVAAGRARAASDLETTMGRAERSERIARGITKGVGYYDRWKTNK